MSTAESRVTVTDRDPMSLARFQALLQGIAARARAMDLRPFEVRDQSSRITAELQPHVLTLLGQARQVLADVLSACDPGDGAGAGGHIGEHRQEDAGGPSFEAAVDATLAAGANSRQLVEEVAFMAQLELGQRERFLRAALPTPDGSALLSECDSCLRRIRKAVSAVDAAIAHLEGVDPLLNYAPELKPALAIRREYARIRRRVLEAGEPTAETLYARFRAVGVEIAILVGRDLYLEMRIPDRLLIRELQTRVLAWLRAGKEASPTEGMRLWEDLIACLEMLQLINRRQEIQQHDREVLQQLAEELHAIDDATAVDTTSWPQLRSLEGLEPQLDALLGSSGPCSVRVLRNLIGRLSDLQGARGCAP